MTVEQLIKALQKYPPKAKVAILDHDQSGEEYPDGSLCWNGPVFTVDDAPDGVKSRGYQVVIR